MLMDKYKQLEESNQVLSQDNKELKEEMLREQMRLSQQIMSMKQQMQASFHMQQSFGLGLQSPFTNPPQGDEDNEDEDNDDDEEYDETHLGD